MDPQFGRNPAAGIATVVPNDTTVLSSVRGLYVGGTGDVAVTMQDGTTGTFKAVPVGTVLPIQVSKVMLTNTTATLILALL